MYNTYKVENLESKIRSLEVIWYGWVEYFRPAKVNLQSNKYNEYKKNVCLYEIDHESYISEIARKCIGSVEGMNAASAMFVKSRIMVANIELKALRLGTTENYYL